MEIARIIDREDFLRELYKVGFTAERSVGGIFALPQYFANPQSREETVFLRKLLMDNENFVCGRFFYGEYGFIVKEWLPYFYRARRDGMSIDEAFSEGMVGKDARKLFLAIREKGSLTVSGMRKILHGAKATQRALLELENGFFVFRRAGAAFDIERLFDAKELCRMNFSEKKEAADKITERILDISPRALKENVEGFIYGQKTDRSL